MCFRRSLLILLIMLSSTSLLRSQTINAASCNASDVQTALNAVTSSTTVVNIPAGTCHWSTQVTINVPSGNNNLSILGAGSVSTVGGGNVTNIVDDYGSNSPLIIVTTSSASSHFRFAGITLQGGTGSVKQNGVLEIGGSSQNVRIDHNHINLSTYASSGEIGVRFINWLNGVFDHNICDDDNGINECVNVEMEGYGNGDWGDGSWSSPTNFGSSGAIFLEDNTFNGGLYIDDCSEGGRQVVRHNIINNAKVQTHPTGSGPRYRGCRSSEVYLNTFNGSSSCDSSAGFNNCAGYMFWLSSGTALVWGNSAPIVNSAAGSGYSYVVSAHNMRKDNSTYSQTATPGGWGYCGSNFNGIGSKWDGSAIGTGYPCLDQVGRGVGDQLSTGDFPSVIDSLLGVISWPHQALEPVYEWNDTFTPVPNNPNGLVAGDVNIVQNQDYYSGVATGPLSSRPSTCTTGVAYFATDQGSWNSSGSGGQGVLYKCTAANTWSLYYTPFAYPHPLVSGTTSPTQSPAPPVSLTGTAK